MNCSCDTVSIIQWRRNCCWDCKGGINVSYWTKGDFHLHCYEDSFTSEGNYVSFRIDVHDLIKYRKLIKYVGYKEPVVFICGRYRPWDQTARSLTLSKSTTDTTCITRFNSSETVHICVLMAVSISSDSTATGSRIFKCYLKKLTVAKCVRYRADCWMVSLRKVRIR